MVQPMAGKVLLPVLGGSPAVWGVCMVFFQGVLLLGYLYAHALTTRVPPRWQGVVHAGLLVVACVTLPFPIDVGTLAGTAPAWWVVRTLSLTVGLPFFALSATAPLLQRWFSRTDDPAAHDPYFLYAASNAGSLLGLLAFPIVVEPLWTRAGQAWAWSGGFWVLTPLLAWAAYAAWRRSGGSAGVPGARLIPEPPEAVTVVRRARWIALALVPSALLLGVTQHLATDVVSAPFLWAVPLALYLATFIAAFAKKPMRTARQWGRFVPWAALLVGVVTLAVIRHPIMLVVSAHLLAFTVLAMACHARLAEDRPGPTRLTEYYLCLSLGGVLGGAATALLAPVVFTSILEYPLALLAAVLLCSRAGEADRAVTTPINRWTWRVAAVLLAGVGWWTVRAFDVGTQTGDVQRSEFGGWLVSVLGGPSVALRVMRAGLLLPAGALLLWPRAAVPAVGALAGVLLGAGIIRAGERTLYRERTFFGVHEVASIQNDHWHILNHGTTMHGVQAFRGDKRFLPTMYYHPTGPIGDVIAVLLREGRFERVGVVGLGVGTLAAYADAGVRMDFYEIDPAVIRIASDPRYFTYLSDAAARPNTTVRTFEGDGRLSLREADEGTYDLLVIDAFSSDAIPAHLLTDEAVALYVSRLKPRGVLAFHISSRYFNLRPVLAKLAEHRGLAFRVCDDVEIHPAHAGEAKRASVWAILARSAEDFGPLARTSPRWMTLPPTYDTPLWTDDYTPVLGVLEGW